MQAAVKCTNSYIVVTGLTSDDPVDYSRNTRTRCEIYLKLTKTPEPRHWRLAGVFIVNFEHIPHLVLVFLLLTLSR